LAKTNQILYANFSKIRKNNTKKSEGDIECKELLCTFQKSRTMETMDFLVK